MEEVEQTYHRVQPVDIAPLRRDQRDRIENGREISDQGEADGESKLGVLEKDREGGDGVCQRQRHSTHQRYRQRKEEVGDRDSSMSEQRQNGGDQKDLD